LLDIPTTKRFWQIYFTIVEYLGWYMHNRFAGTRET